MENIKTHPLTVSQQWLKALQDNRFRIEISITTILLLGCAFTAPIVFNYIQQRNGIILQDFVLDILPSMDLSNWIFLTLYSLILLGVLQLTAYPFRFLMTLKAYVLLTLLRFITLLLVPLEPPQQITVLIDPFVQHLFYQQTITKDLFFSGHTSILLLLGWAMPRKWQKWFLYIGAIAVASMLLLQHAHYTIDILVAPGFTWLAIALARQTRQTNTESP
jgi:hypothetical protein